MSESDPPGQGDAFADMTEPYVATFAVHLPFVLGFGESIHHAFQTDHQWVNPDDSATFGPAPWVRIRVCNIEATGLRVYPPGVTEALTRLYRSRNFEENLGEPIHSDSLKTYEQWLSLETPGALSTEDRVGDRGYTFHRCMKVLNWLLRAVLIASHNTNIREVTTHDLKPSIVIGAIPHQGEWRQLAVMFMHPEGQSQDLMPNNAPINNDQLQGALHAIKNEAPYLRTILWRSRAQFALLQEGDAPDAIISFQTAAETMLFDAYRIMLVDEGCQEEQIIQEMASDISFRSLLTRILPGRLGGPWDVTKYQQPIGKYWKDLYLVRNQVVHAGRYVHGGDAEKAQSAYRSLRDHLENRLWIRRIRYPRAFLSRVPEDTLKQKGWNVKWVLDLKEKLRGEASPYWWPWDRAGRQPPGP